jgi:hypothetical protein
VEQSGEVKVKFSLYLIRRYSMKKSGEWRYRSLQSQSWHYLDVNDQTTVLDPENKSPSRIHWIRGGVGPGAGRAMTRIPLPAPGIEPRFPGRSGCRPVTIPTESLRLLGLYNDAF